LPAPSLSKLSSARAAASEVYSAALIVAITLALSGAVYSLSDFHVTPVPVYTTSSFSVYANPSFLHIQVNSSAPSAPAELRIDNASSLAGFLELSTAGYSTTNLICSAGETTFFSVSAGPGTISVSGSGVSWIDGIEGSSAEVQRGWHEVALSGGSGCVVTLPGGTEVSGPSPSSSPLPMESLSSRTFVFLVPFYSSGHVATIVFDGGSQVLGF
jgi:hypothetical protein